MNRPPFLSVIIPVHNEERRLATCMEQVIAHLSTYYQNRHEIIIVDNGSTDDTHGIARAYANTYRNVFVLHEAERGKGAAIRRGMLFAEGDYRYMCDVDLSTPIHYVGEFLKLRKNYDVIIGSREVAPALAHTTLTRRVVGRMFHALVGDLVPGVKDTQCGFKLFSALAAEAVFSRLQLRGLAFDVEALYLARRLDYPLTEIPVHWEHNPDSRVRLFWDALEMARDVASIPFLHMGEKIPA